MPGAQQAGLQPSGEGGMLALSGKHGEYGPDMPL